MNILLFSHKFSPDIGGIESISEMLAHEFVSHGHVVHVVTWSISKEEDSFPFRIIRHPDIKKLLRQFQWTDVVVENNPCTRLSWPNQWFRKPSVISLQTWPSWQQGSLNVGQCLKKAWLNRADQLIACSYALQQKSFPTAKVIANPYNQTIFYRYPDLASKHDFVFLGRLVSDKGADLAISALSRLNEMTNQSYTLTIIGDGLERQALENQVRKFDLQKQVIFAGPMRGERLARCLNEHRFLLVPSLWEEPFGIVALEGMACGCIPIVADGGGLPEAVGKAGVLFERGNVDALAICMHQVLNDQALVAQLGYEALAHLQRHTQAHVAQQYLAILEDAVH